MSKTLSEYLTKKLNQIIGIHYMKDDIIIFSFSDNNTFSSGKNVIVIEKLLKAYNIIYKYQEIFTYKGFQISKENAHLLYTVLRMEGDVKCGL